MTQKSTQKTTQGSAQGSAQSSAQSATAKSSPNPTWYDILGVAHDARPDAIKAAWRAATDKFEPGSGTSQFRLFNEAADVLLDAERRAAYDAELAGAAEPDLEVASDEAEPEEVAPEAAATGEAGPDRTGLTVGTESEAALEPLQDAEEPEESEEPAPATASTPAGGGFLGRLAAIPVLVLAMVGVVMVAALVLAGVIGVRLHDRVAVANAGPDASAAAERALTAVLSYDYRHMQTDRDRAARFLTPSYRKQYLKNFDDLLAKGPDGSPGPVEKTKAVVTADVLDTGVVDAERNRVRVIVFVNQSSVKGEDQPTLFQNRVVATLVHRGDSWLVDNIKSY